MGSVFAQYTAPLPDGPCARYYLRMKTSPLLLICLILLTTPCCAQPMKATAVVDFTIKIPAMVRYTQHPDGSIEAKGNLRGMQVRVDCVEPAKQTEGAAVHACSAQGARKTFSFP